MKTHQSQIKAILNNYLKNHQIIIHDHSDPTLIGIEGIIQSESKNTLIIQDNNKTKRVEKLHGKFIFKIDESEFLVPGKILVGLPRSRAKKKFHNW